MEGFSICSHCGWLPSCGTRGALLVATLLTLYSLLEALCETQVTRHGFKPYETWVRRVSMVAFAGSAAAGSDLQETVRWIATTDPHIRGVIAAGAAESLMGLAVCLGSAAVIALMSAAATRIGAKRHLGATRSTFLAHPRIFAFGLGLLALLFVSACLFVSRSITGSANADALERGSRVAAVAQIGSLVILALLVAQSIWARAKRRKMQPTGRVSNRVFAGTMIIFGAVSLLLALYAYATIRKLSEMAMSG